MNRRLRPSVAVRVVAGVSCLVVGGVRRARASSPTNSTHHGDADLLLILGGRYLAQGLAMRFGRLDGLRTRLAVESLHAASMVAVALESPQLRRTAGAAAGIAATVLLTDVATR